MLNVNNCFGGVIFLFFFKIVGILQFFVTGILKYLSICFIKNNQIFIAEKVFFQVPKEENTAAWEHCSQVILNCIFPS